MYSGSYLIVYIFFIVCFSSIQGQECYNILIQGKIVEVCNPTTLKIRDSDWSQENFAFNNQSEAWFILDSTIKNVSNIFVLETVFNESINYSFNFYDQLGLNDYSVNHYPEIDSHLQKGKYWAHVLSTNNNTNRLFLSIKSKNYFLGSLNMTFVLAKNYSNYNHFPARTNSAPYQASIPPLGYLFANWELPESQKEGLVYVQVSSNCHNSQINQIAVYFNQCQSGQCLYPSMSNLLSMNFSTTNISVNVITYQLGFPENKITSKNKNLLATIVNPYSYHCDVTIDAYSAEYQIFRFNSFITQAFLPQSTLYYNRYQPFRIENSETEAFHVRITFNLNLANSPTTDLALYYSGSDDDKSQNMENRRAALIITEKNNGITFSMAIGAPYTAFSIYNLGLNMKSSIFSLDLKTARISWGYWICLLLGAMMIAFIIFLAILLRVPKEEDEYEPINQGQNEIY